MPPRFRRVHRRALPLLLLWFSVGCFGPQREWRDDLVWSPDGKHAAVLRVGFRLSDTEGNLTPQLDDRVYRVAWLDSEQLVLARSRTISTFAEIAAAVGPDRTRAIAAQAEHTWTHIQSPDFPEFVPDIPMSVVVLYLREHYADAIREKSGEYWTQIEHATAELHQLVVAHVVDGRLEIGITLSEDVQPIKTIQPAPNRRSVAFVTLDEEFVSSDEIARLHVVPIEASARPTLVAEDTGDSVDWSPDSRSLLYFSESGWDPNIGRYGCLGRLPLVDESGTVVPPKNLFAKCMSYLIFERSDRVASLSDGRVLFEGASIELPSDSRSITHQLFVLAREPDDKYPMIDRFPITPLIPQEVLEREAGMAFFDLSPDRRRVIYGTWTGDMRVLTLEDGRAELLPLGLHGESYFPRDLPKAVWSGPDAFTYVKKIGTRNEFILRRGSAETILSRSWPREMLSSTPSDSTGRGSAHY